MSFETASLRTSPEYKRDREQKFDLENLLTAEIHEFSAFAAPKIKNTFQPSQTVSERQRLFFEQMKEDPAWENILRVLGTYANINRSFKEHLDAVMIAKRVAELALSTSHKPITPPIQFLEGTLFDAVNPQREQGRRSPQALLGEKIASLVEHPTDTQILFAHLIARSAVYTALLRYVPGAETFHADRLGHLLFDELQTTSEKLQKSETVYDTIAKCEAIAFTALANAGKIQAGTRLADGNDYEALAQENLKRVAAFWEEILPDAAEIYRTLANDTAVYTSLYKTFEREQTQTRVRFDEEIEKKIHAFGEPFLGYEIPRYEQLLLQNTDSMIDLLKSEVLRKYPDAPLVFFDHSARPLGYLLRKRWETRKKRGEDLPELPAIKFMSDDDIKNRFYRTEKDEREDFPWPFPEHPNAVIFIDDFTAHGTTKTATLSIPSPFEKFFMTFFGRGNDALYPHKNSDQRLGFMEATYDQGTPWHLLPMTVGVWTRGKGEDRETLSSKTALEYNRKYFHEFVKRALFGSFEGNVRSTWNTILRKCLSDAECEEFNVETHDTQELATSVENLNQKFHQQLQRLLPEDQLRLEIAKRTLQFIARMKTLLEPGKEAELEQYILDQQKVLRKRLTKLAEL